MRASRRSEPMTFEDAMPDERQDPVAEDPRTQDPMRDETPLLPLEAPPGPPGVTPAAGATPPAHAGEATGPVDPATLQQRVVEMLRSVFDPEIPVNIYDLGLVYGIDVDPAGAVEVRMTL